MREVFESGADKLQAGSHQKCLSAPPTSLFVEGDPVRLGQVFVNILNNAANTRPMMAPLI
jgi:phosphoglycerate-specific signal transduction histidine kinase